MNTPRQLPSYSCTPSWPSSQVCHHHPPQRLPCNHHRLWRNPHQCCHRSQLSTHALVHSSKLSVASSQTSACLLDLRVLAASVLSAPRLTRTPSRSSLRDIPPAVDTGLTGTEADQGRLEGESRGQSWRRCTDCEPSLSLSTTKVLKESATQVTL